jgi:hypothetical protein
LIKTSIRVGEDVDLLARWEETLSCLERCESVPALGDAGLTHCHQTIATQLVGATNYMCVAVSVHLNFFVERLEEKKPQKANAEKRKRVEAKTKEANEAQNNEKALQPRAKGPRRSSRPNQPNSKRQKRAGSAEPVSPTPATLI